MKKVTYIIIVLVLLVGGYFILNKKPASPQEVKLGVIAGTTGQYASAGEGFVNGFNLAISEWNNSHEPKFVAVIEDDGFNATKGLSAYKKLTSIDKPEAYVVLSSFTIDAIYDLVHSEKKPIALGFEQSKPAEDDNIFQVLPAAKPIQVGLGEKVKSLGLVKPVVALSNTTSVYQNFYDGFNQGFGGNVKKFEVGSDIGAIRSQALAITKENPDVVAVYMAPTDGAMLVKEIIKITGDKHPFFVFDQSIVSGGTDYAKILGTEIRKIDGSLVSMSKNDFTKDFQDKYMRKYNTPPTFGTDMGYNAFMLLANTYANTSNKWIGNMKKAKFTGADGELSFDGVGLRVPDIFFGTLDNGEVVIK